MRQFSISKFTPLLSALLTASWLMLTFALVTEYYLAKTTLLPNIYPIDGSISSSTVYDPHLAVTTDREQFRKELDPEIRRLEGTEAKTLRILSWVMNQFPRVENWAAHSSWEMIEHGRAGGGLICGGLAQVFHDALVANGIPARRVILWRNMFELGDTHTTVEAFIDGKWRIFDPTFHVSVKIGGERVGAFDVQQHLEKSGPKNIAIEFHGSVKYPARTETYYIDYLVLFDNVFVEVHRSLGYLRAIPLIGPLIGPQWVYPGNIREFDVSHIQFYRLLYLSTMIVLPALALLFFVAAVAVWLRIRRIEAAKALRG